MHIKKYKQKKNDYDMSVINYIFCGAKHQQQQALVELLAP